MYFIRFVFLQFLVFALSESQKILPGIDEYTEMYKVDMAKAKELCRNRTVSLEEHPYHAFITSPCTDQFYHGVIISDRYVLTKTDPRLEEWRNDGCAFIAHVGADAENSRVADHEADFVLDGVFSMFKLKEPIEFGRRAQKIEIAGETPESGELATITRLSKNFMDTTDVLAYNVTVFSAQDCMKLTSARGLNDTQRCKNTLWVENPKILFPDHFYYSICSQGYSPALINKHGQLIGVAGNKEAFRLQPGRSIDSYVDLTRHKAIIEKYAQISE